MTTYYRYGYQIKNLESHLKVAKDALCDLCDLSTNKPATKEYMTLYKKVAELERQILFWNRKDFDAQFSGRC